MDWVCDVKGKDYAQLLTNLLGHCDSVQCIVREDVDDYFEEMKDELLEKRYVTEWPLTKLGQGAVPVVQYTFRYNFKTATFLKWMHSSLFSWQLPYPEDLSFWKGEKCLLATCAHEQYVEIHADVENELAAFFVRKC